MESLLVWWNLEWHSPGNYPVYSTYTATQHQCLLLIKRAVKDMPGREMLGYWKESTKTCQLAIFSERSSK